MNIRFLLFVLIALALVLTMAASPEDFIQEVVFNHSAGEEPEPTNTELASDTQDDILVPNTEQEIETAISPVFDPEREKKILEKLAQDLAIAQAQLEAIKIPESEPERERLPQNELYGLAINSVVNFFCEVEGGKVALATGVIIHEAGFVLTNSHIITEPDPPPCLLRMGSPARNYATAERVFNGAFDPESNDGENFRHDVSIWKIVESATKTPLPQTFSAFTVDPTQKVNAKDPLSTFSYPAELLGSQIILNTLHLVFSETIVSVHDPFFIESTQGIGSQKGSSGGILVDPFTGNFSGLIFAISNNDDTSDISKRSLFSLTPFAINQAVIASTGRPLKQFLQDQL